MKQALILFIIVTLFSFLFAIDCPPNAKIVCQKNDIRTCRCANKNAGGTFAVSHSCNAPQHPHCEGNYKIVNCFCR